MRFDASRPAAALACIWWVALVAAVLAWRPLTAVDETRYATVAWEMWLSGDAISLHLNGALYGDKPPLLFWLINLGWWVAGPSAWWPQLLTALFALAALAVVQHLARQLAPGHDAIAAMTVLISASTLFWMAFTGAVMFDIVLSFFVLLGVAAVVRAASNGGWRPWWVAGAALGLGILAKGPVALLHVLPLALLAPWWRHRVSVSPAAHQGWGRWYAGVALAVLIAAV
ncbi:MAG TPA: glycosyltransferase family 39 protein, partial [Burkholderiaceae bacterium]|nr:glycosyltransferase family 39 protein [Burkholderiaceae bacterium]